MKYALTPEQRIQRDIILEFIKVYPNVFMGNPTNAVLNGEYDEIFETLDTEAGYTYEDYRQEAEREFREGGKDTGLDGDWSRHYESREVAKQLSDGGWVGWTYWYGGGKHGQPAEIDWINYAYELEVEETQELVTVRKWTKVEQEENTNG